MDGLYDPSSHLCKIKAKKDILYEIHATEREMEMEIHP
jgi:hypothetical protein